MQLKALELEIGFSLFIRDHRKLVLTEFGRALKIRAESLFLMADQIVAEFPLMGSYPKEEFNLGVLRTVPSHYVMSFSEFLWQDFLLNTSIVEHSREGLLAGLDNGSLDFVLSDEIETQSERYLSIHLGSSTLMAFAGQRSLFNGHDFPRCLDGRYYLSPFSQGQMQLEIDHYFSRSDVTPKSFGRVDSISLMKMVTENNPCFCVLPQCVLRKEIELGMLQKLGELPDVRFNLWGVFPKSSSKKLNIEKIITNFLLQKNAGESRYINASSKTERMQIR